MNATAHLIRRLLPDPPAEIWQNTSEQLCSPNPKKLSTAVGPVVVGRPHFRYRQCPVCAGDAATVWIPERNDAGIEFVICAAGCDDESIDYAIATAALYERLHTGEGFG